MCDNIILHGNIPCVIIVGLRDNISLRDNINFAAILPAFYLKSMGFTLKKNHPQKAYVIIINPPEIL